MLSRFPCVDAFMAGFAELAPHEREEAASEVQDFLDGYHDGKEEKFADAEGEPSVLGESSAVTLAETMSYHGVKPGKPLC